MGGGGGAPIGELANESVYLPLLHAEYNSLTGCVRAGVVVSGWGGGGCVGVGGGGVSGQAGVVVSG